MVCLVSLVRSLSLLGSLRAGQPMCPRRRGICGLFLGEGEHVPCTGVLAVHPCLRLGAHGCGRDSICQAGGTGFRSGASGPLSTSVGPRGLRSVPRFAGFCEDLSGPCPVPPMTVLPGILGPCRVLADPVAAAQHGAGTRKSFKGPGCWGADGTGPRFPTELSVSIGASSSGRRTPKTGLIEA